MKYKNQTVLAKEALGPLSQVAGKAINAKSLDISKRAVGEAFAEVFGYQLAVDPVQYEGRMIEKSNQNAAHDGRVIQGPILASELKAECVYQKEINNAHVEDGYFSEYRVPLYGGQIPVAYLKIRPAQSRFLPQNQVVTLVEPSEVFSPEEKDRLAAFAARMGLDFGELDVLRDSDGRIYVVDANNTPFGPPKTLPEDQKRIAANRLAEAFANLLRASA